MRDITIPFTSYLIQLFTIVIICIGTLNSVNIWWTIALAGLAASYGLFGYIGLQQVKVAMKQEAEYEEALLTDADNIPTRTDRLH